MIILLFIGKIKLDSIGVLYPADKGVTITNLFSSFYPLSIIAFNINKWNSFKTSAASSHIGSPTLYQHS